MQISIFKIFIIFGIVSQWADKALSDGKVTLQEAVDLAKPVAEILGIPLEIEIPLTDSQIEGSEETPSSNIQVRTPKTSA